MSDTRARWPSMPDARMPESGEPEYSGAPHHRVHEGRESEVRIVERDHTMRAMSLHSERQGGELRGVLFHAAREERDTW